jgi:tRNA pseudouridine55 synthase
MTSTMPALDGLVIVDKPSGWTSHDVVGRVRTLAGTRKVGHAGTLDPMATGVLVLGLGRATRLLGHLALSSKGYDATIRLGQSTTTDDADGEPLDQVDATGVTSDELVRGVEALTGDIDQVPSSVSAIKVGGQRAYKRVRSGEAVELSHRAVTVSQFSIKDVRRHGSLLDVDVHVECSTGTYIRALARDLGAALEVGGHLTRLRRTRVGVFRLDGARTLDQLVEDLSVLPLDRAAADNFPTYTVEAGDVPAVRNGRQISVQLPTLGPVAMISPNGAFLALYEQRGPVAKAVAVFAPA